MTEDLDKNRVLEDTTDMMEALMIMNGIMKTMYKRLSEIRKEVLKDG